LDLLVGNLPTEVPNAVVTASAEERVTTAVLDNTAVVRNG